MKKIVGKKWYEVICPECKEKIILPAYKVKRGPQRNHFCSPECSHKYNKTKCRPYRKQRKTPHKETKRTYLKKSDKALEKYVNTMVDIFGVIEDKNRLHREFY